MVQQWWKQWQDIRIEHATRRTLRKIAKRRAQHRGAFVSSLESVQVAWL